MRYLSLLFVGACLSACHTPPASKQTPQDVRLSAVSMYERDSVLLVVKQGKGNQKEADKLFLQAIDTYRNKKKVASSIILFRQSILQQPQAKTYYEMGNALMDGDDLSQAVKAFTMAEAMDYKPLYKVLYNQACAWSRLNNLEKAKYYLVSAIEFGYSNLKNIYNDPDLAFVRQQHYSFKQMITDAYSGATDPDKLEWHMFAREFHPLELPVVLDMKYDANLTDGQYIPYDYERYIAEMRDVAFSRDVGRFFYYVGLVKSTDSVKTLVYAAKDEVGDEQSPAVYYLASYGITGKLIDKMQIGGHEKYTDPFKVATIQQNGDIQVGRFNFVYEKDPEVNGYEDNKILETKELEKEYYTLSVDGHFVKQTALLGLR